MNSRLEGHCNVCGKWAYLYELRRICGDCVVEAQRLSKLFRAR